jgi:hypothetical protein
MFGTDVIFLVGGLGLEIKAFYLQQQQQMLYHLSHTSSPFCFGYF